nr:hypothetical protein [Tanacetum cinerariifolium]
MLDRTDFASWQQWIRLYCRGKKNGVNIDEGPYHMGTVRETLAESTEGTPQYGPKRPRVYSDLTSEEKDRTFLPQTNNQLRTSSNARNQATVQDGRMVVQNVHGRPNRGQGMNPQGKSAAGYGGAQNRVGNVNPGPARPGQARPMKCYNYNGTWHIAQENGVALDAKQLLFLADPVTDEARPSYDSDILSEVPDHDHYQDVACAYHEEHVMHDSVQLDHVVDLQADYTTNSNMIPYDQLLSATITLYLKVEDPILKEHQRCVQGKEALNILKDPRGDIMVLTSLPKRSLMPVSFGPPSIRMPTSLSKTVTRTNDREKFHNVMRCLKTQSKFVKSLTFEALTLWAHSRLHEGTNIFSWPSIICRNGLKRNCFPPMTPELFANILNLSSPDLVPLELS